MEGTDSTDGGRIAQPAYMEKVDKRSERREEKNKVKKPKTKRKGRQEQEDKNKKKDRMRTSLDVIKRLQWDENLPKDFFTIGYVDRFKGIVEDPFTKFSHWGDLANADDNVDLAIPQHRIVYFKYKDTKVWDKTQRLDLIFNSTLFQGDFQGKTIEDVMQNIDDRLSEARFDERDGAGAGTDSGSNDNDSTETSDDDDDSDSDSDERLAISIKPVDASQFKPIPDEERSTHFIAIKITEPEIVDNAVHLQHHIADQEEALGDCCMGSGLFHLTLAMLRLHGDDGVDEATKLVQEIQGELQDLLDKRGDKKAGLKISGLDTFGQRVLFAKVRPESDDLFWQFVGTVLDKVAKSSSAVGVTNKFELTPHMTLVKVNRPVSKARKSKFLPSRLYEDFVQMDFGVQPINNLQLCVIEATTRNDGFYKTLSEIKFKV